MEKALMKRAIPSGTIQRVKRLSAPLNTLNACHTLHLLVGAHVSLKGCATPRLLVAVCHPRLPCIVRVEGAEQWA
jgi:hypothetical protein